MAITNNWYPEVVTNFATRLQTQAADLAEMFANGVNLDELAIKADEIVYQIHMIEAFILAEEAGIVVNDEVKQVDKLIRRVEVVENLILTANKLMEEIEAEEAAAPEIHDALELLKTHPEAPSEALKKQLVVSLTKLQPLGIFISENLTGGYKWEWYNSTGYAPDFIQATEDALNHSMLALLFMSQKQNAKKILKAQAQQAARTTGE